MKEEKTNVEEKSETKMTFDEREKKLYHTTTYEGPTNIFGEQGGKLRQTNTAIFNEEEIKLLHTKLTEEKKKAEEQICIIIEKLGEASEELNTEIEVKTEGQLGSLELLKSQMGLLKKLDEKEKLDNALKNTAEQYLRYTKDHEDLKNKVTPRIKLEDN